MLALLWGGCGSGSGGNASHPIIRSSGAVLIPKNAVLSKLLACHMYTQGVLWQSVMYCVMAKKTDGLEVHILALTSSFSTKTYVK